MVVLHSFASRRVARHRGKLGLVIGGAAIAAFAAAGCGSSTDTKGKTGSVEACKLKDCGTTCTADADCKPGTFCGTTDGKCTAACVIGAVGCTDSTLQCSSTGRCVQKTLVIGTGGSGSVGDSGSCQIDAFAGEKIPTDIYIMNDRSTSMTCATGAGDSRWAEMSNALTSFVNDSAASGLGVGMQYFSLGPNFDSCDVNLYSQAAVPIATLPGNAKAIIDSLNANTATTNPVVYTATPAAMQGAVNYAQAWKASHPSHMVAIVLATDGQPNKCGNVADVANIAAAAFKATPSIPTYVIGIVQGSGSCNNDPSPPNVADLNTVATAGGTGTAFVVDPAQGDAAAKFLDAMNAIRGATQIPCQYVIPTTTPSGQTIDAGKVRVQLVPQGGTAADVPPLSGPNACDANGGWYFDPQDSQRVILCDATCSDLTTNNPQINFILACEDTVPIR